MGVVFHGSKEKTLSGLTKGALHKNKRGKIVSKKATAAGKKSYQNISGWTKAVTKARKELGVTGFCAWVAKQPKAGPFTPRPSPSTASESVNLIGAARKKTSRFCVFVVIHGR